jgi:hypothetical protein
LCAALILVLRLAIAGQYRGNFDSASYRIAAAAVLSGQNVYAATDRYNYSPAWSYFVAGLWKLAAPNASLFILLIGLSLIVVDALTALLLARLASRRLGFPEDEARRAALLFFSNPISVLLSCAHGQFDSLSILLLLAAIFASLAPDSARRGWAVAAALSGSLLVKHVTAFHIPLFWKRLRRPGYPAALLAVPYLVFAASFWPYRSAWRQIFRNVFLYGAQSGSRWQQHAGGWQMFFRFEPGPGVAAAAVFAALVTATIWKTRWMPLPRAALVLFLVNLTFLPSSAVQYLIWPVALGSLYPGIGFALFTAAGALYHSSAPESLAIPWPLRVSVAGTWFAALVWLVLEISRREGTVILPAEDAA